MSTNDPYARLTARAKKVIELSLREAMSLGHNYVGTEHLLLALVREGEGVAARVLESLGVTPENIRNEVIRILTGPGVAKPKDEDELVKRLATQVVEELLNRGFKPS